MYSLFEPKMGEATTKCLLSYVTHSVCHFISTPSRSRRSFVIVVVAFSEEILLFFFGLHAIFVWTAVS